MVSRWSINDFAKFEALIDKIKDLMDGLEGITSSLDVLEHQRSLLTEEIESISDTHSLRLLRDVSSSHSTSPSFKVISDAVSQRLSIFVTSVPSEISISNITGNSESYHTAQSHQHEVPSIVTLDPHLSDDAHSHGLPLEHSALRNRIQRKYDSRTHAGPVSADKIQETIKDLSMEPPIFPIKGPSDADIPQNQRLMAELMKKTSTSFPAISFKSGASHYGGALAHIKENDVLSWNKKSADLLVKADKGMSAA